MHWSTHVVKWMLNKVKMKKNICNGFFTPQTSDLSKKSFKESLFFPGSQEVKGVGPNIAVRLWLKQSPCSTTMKSGLWQQTLPHSLNGAAFPCLEFYLISNICQVIFIALCFLLWSEMLHGVFAVGFGTSHH